MITISTEGPDKAGKHTAVQTMLHELTELGVRATVLEFPQYDTPIGELIRKWLHNDLNVNHQSFELLQAADKATATDTINKFKHDYDVILIDRYVHSQIAYGLYQNELSWLLELAQPCITPDYTFYLEVDPTTSMQRKGQHGKNDKYENDLNLLKALDRNYNIAFRERPNKLIRIDANQPIDNVQEIIKKEIRIIAKHN